MPDGYFNSLIRNRFSSGKDVIWSGFLGGELAGSHISFSSQNLYGHNNVFSSWQHRGKSYPLCSHNFSFSETLPLQNSDILIAYDDALDFGIRQAHAIAPTVLPIHAWQGWNPLIGKDQSGAQVIAPFADPTWAGYWLTAPREVRKGKKLYLEMLNMKFPDLFALPGKADLGVPKYSPVQYRIRWLHHHVKGWIKNNYPWVNIGSTRGHNYLDFDEMFRTRDDYKATLLSAFDYLKQEEVVPWLDLDALWNEHMDRKKNHQDAFRVLLGLAANLLVNPIKDYG